MVGVRDAQVVPSAPVQQAQLQTLVGGMERGTSCRISPGHFGKIEEENSFLSRGQGVTGLPQARGQGRKAHPDQCCPGRRRQGLNLEAGAAAGGLCVGAGRGGEMLE